VGLKWDIAETSAIVASLLSGVVWDSDIGPVGRRVENILLSVFSIHMTYFSFSVLRHVLVSGTRVY